jgi:hypothetical protein
VQPPPRPDEAGSSQQPPWFLVPALVLGAIVAVVMVVLLVLFVLAWAAFE